MRKAPAFLSDLIGKQRNGSTDFDLNPQYAPKSVALKDAAVLVAFGGDPDAPDLILTKRSSRLRHHAGQIAFAGGKKDDTDPSLEFTALREANEEIGLPFEAVEVLGALPSHQTVTQFLMTPIIAWVGRDFESVAEQGEVDEVFTVPWAHVSDPNNYLIQSRKWQGSERRFYTVPYGPYYIWGATARILRSMAEVHSSAS